MVSATREGLPIQQRQMPSGSSGPYSTRNLVAGAAGLNLKLVEEAQIEARPEQLFQAWTDEQLLITWWKNAEFRTTRWQGEVRPAGPWQLEFEDANGNIYTAEGKYQVVQPPHRLSFTWKPGWDDGPATTIELEFRAAPKGTTVRLTQAGIASAAAFSGNQKAWSQTLSMLRRFLSENAG